MLSNFWVVLTGFRALISSKIFAPQNFLNNSSTFSAAFEKNRNFAADQANPPVSDNSQGDTVGNYTQLHGHINVKLTKLNSQG